MDPSARGSVSLEENLKITKADAVQALAQKAWGAPVLGFFGRLVSKLFGVDIPQPLVGVIDTGVDTSHPMLKGVRAVNATSGPNVDDNGHGSWVTSMILNYARWLKSLTHYKVFTANGGATLDDILKALTLAGNDGNLIISNSWGSDQGDPQSPDSQLVRKLAAEGHVMVFAAGNSGPRANTVGSPAIVTYKDAKTGAIRVVSVAATDRDKKVAYFSSRGPGSRTTARDPNYKDHRPDLSAPGYNTDGAWPTDRPYEADRVDPVYGPLKAISGTSMATPAVAGAIALLAQVFGVTTMGEKLDAIVNGVMATLFKTGQSPDAEGQGFIDVEAAFQAVSQVLTPVIPGFAARVVLKLAARSLARQAGR
jgi:subtilisin family serine protease